MIDKTDYPLVSIVILNWNGLEDTKKCLASVANLTYKNYEVIVVDNGSREDSKLYLSSLKDIVYVDNAKNEGFTGGHIDGLAHTKGDIVLLLNNDAVVKPNLLDEGVKHFVDPAVFAVGGRAYQWDDSLPVYDEANPFYSFQEINPITAEARTHSADLGKPQEVNNVSGASVFVSRALVEKIGYLYRPFFAYYEETDLFARAKRAGYKVLYDPELMIWHKNGASTSNNRSFFFYMMSRNRWLFAVRNFDSPFLKKFIKRQTKASIKAFIFSIIRRDTNEWAQFRGYCAGLFMSPQAFRARKELGSRLHGSYNRKIFDESPTPATIAIDCRKSTDGLEKTLKSISLQTHLSYEVLIITRRATVSDKKLENLSGNIRVILDKEQIPVRFENYAVPHAKYEWLLYLNAGDTIPPDYLSNLLFAGLLKASKIIYSSSYDSSEPLNIWSNNPIGRIYLVSKPFLIDAGGYDNSLSQIDAHHQLIAKFVANRAVITTCKLSDQPVGKDIHPDAAPIPAEIRVDLESQARIARKSHGFMEKLKHIYRSVANHSRVLQWIVMLIEWLFEPLIKFRSKLGRLKLLFKAALTGKRQAIVLQLKHMRNELLRSHSVGHNQVDFSPQDVPIFIICRDRIQPLSKLITWLESKNYQNIILVDNDSTYPKLTEYYKFTPYQVIFLDRNAGHTSPWTSGAIQLFASNQYYVATDPDVIPDQDCPADTLKYLHSLLIKYPNFIKAGLGLRIDDLPKHYALRQQVIDWESQFWLNPLEDNVYEAGVDTTFALYQPKSYYCIHPSLRTGAPYVAQHLPWYVNSKELTEEDVFYREHAESSINSWDSDTLRDRYSKEMDAK